MARRSRAGNQGTHSAHRPLGHLNSTDVTAELFFRGHRIDRRRLAWVADALWPNGDLRESDHRPRLYTREQVDQVELALTLLDSDFGIEVEDLAEAARQGRGVIETMRTVVRSRHDALDTLDQRICQPAPVSPVEPLNSGDVTAELFFRGYRIDRRRLASVADALWPGCDVRKSNRRPRFFTPEQVDRVGLALTLLDSDFGIEVEDLAEAALQGRGVIETLRTVVRSRHGALNALDQRICESVAVSSGPRLVLHDEGQRQRQEREAVSA